MKFNGTILITDPCYFCNDDLFITFNRKRPTCLVVDSFRVEAIKSSMDICNRVLDCNVKKEAEDFILKELRALTKRLEDLQKEEYKIRSADKNKQATNFLSEFGFTDCIWGDTLYGDWDCSVFNSDTNQVIGQFCADGGMFCVMYLEEVLKYNPNFDYHINKPHTCTVIENFVGDIEVKIIETTFIHNGEEMIDQSIEIHGKGNVNFVTKQTGF